jgi:hypothetical protein
MGLESATFISQLVATNPLGADDRSTADDHLRLLKSVLQSQFPNLGASAVNPTAAQLNHVVGVTSAIQTQLNAKAPLAAPSFTGVVNSAGQLRLSVGANIASAASLTLGADGNHFVVTGTTAITSIATVGVGTIFTLQFAGILTLTHHATNLILPGNANITTAAGDTALVIEYATGDFKVLNYQRQANTILNAPVAGHVKAGNMQILEGETNPGGALFVHSLMVAGIGETIGPTGSGATNIWTSLDSMPSNAQIVILNLRIGVKAAVTDFAALTVYYAWGDRATSPPTNREIALLAEIECDGIDQAHESIVDMQVLVPLGANNDFWLEWWTSGVSIGEQIHLRYRGFITD